MVPREKEVLRAVEPLTRAGVVRGTAIFLSYPAPRLRVHPRVLTGGKYRDTTFNSSTGGVGEPRPVSAESRRLIAMPLAVSGSNQADCGSPLSTPSPGFKNSVVHAQRITAVRPQRLKQRV